MFWPYLGYEDFGASAPWARLGGPPPELVIVVGSTARKWLKTSRIGCDGAVCSSQPYY